MLHVLTTFFSYSYRFRCYGREVGPERYHGAPRGGCGGLGTPPTKAPESGSAARSRTAARAEGEHRALPRRSPPKAGEDEALPALSWHHPVGLVDAVDAAQGGQQGVEVGGVGELELEAQDRKSVG